MSATVAIAGLKIDRPTHFLFQNDVLDMITVKHAMPAFSAEDPHDCATFGLGKFFQPLHERQPAFAMMSGASSQHTNLATIDERQMRSCGGFDRLSRDRQP